MRTALTTEELNFYQTNGFLVVPDFLDDKELAQWRETVDEAVAERGWRRFAGPNSYVPDQESLTEADRERIGYSYDDMVTQRLNLWQTNDKVRRLMLDERLGRLAADLSGVDGIRIWEDRAMIKRPYAEVSRFHRDGPHWSFTSGDVVQMWVAIEDATLENGCLYFVPGTHRLAADPDEQLGRSLGEFFDMYPEWKEVMPVPCPLPAGGACFFNGMTVHGAGANMTPRPRVAMTCHYMPDGCTYNGSRGAVLPPDYLDSLRVGDPLSDDRHNPLIFSRKRATSSAG